MLLVLLCAVSMLDLLLLNAYFGFAPSDTPHRTLQAVLWFGIPFLLKCTALGFSAYGALTCRKPTFWYGIGACFGTCILQAVAMVLA